LRLLNIPAYLSAVKLKKKRRMYQIFVRGPILYVYYVKLVLEIIMAMSWTWTLLFFFCLFLESVPGVSSEFSVGSRPPGGEQQHPIFDYFHYYIRMVREITSFPFSSRIPAEFHDGESAATTGGGATADEEDEEDFSECGVSPYDGPPTPDDARPSAMSQREEVEGEKGGGGGMASPNGARGGVQV
jgi:hypothetical protein